MLASALTVAAFVGTTAYTQYRLTKLDTLSATIAGNAVPTLEYLGRGGIRLQRVRELFYDALATPEARRLKAEAALAELARGC